MTNGPIDSAIAERKAALERLLAKMAELETSAQRLRGEISGLEYAKSLMAQSADRPQEPVQAGGKATAHQVFHPAAALRLSPLWRQMLEFIGRQMDRTTSLDGMIAYADGEGLSVNRNTLRSQMSIYKSRGYVENPSFGTYRLTDKGMALIRELEERAAAKPLSFPHLFGGGDRGETPDNEARPKRGDGQNEDESDLDFMK